MVKFLQQVTLLSSPIHTTRLQPIVKTLPSSHGNKQQFLEHSLALYMRRSHANT